MVFRVPRTSGVNGAERCCTPFQRSPTNHRYVIDVWRELRNHRDIHGRADRGNDVADHLGILSHRHAVAFGVGTGKIQFQSVRNGGQLLRDRDKFLNRAAENGDEQKPIVGHSQARKTFKRFVHPRVG